MDRFGQAAAALLRSDDDCDCGSDCGSDCDCDCDCGRGCGCECECERDRNRGRDRDRDCGGEGDGACWCWSVKVCSCSWMLKSASSSIQRNDRRTSSRARWMSESTERRYSDARSEVELSRRLASRMRSSRERCLRCTVSGSSSGSSRNHWASLRDSFRRLGGDDAADADADADGPASAAACWLRKQSLDELPRVRPIRNLPLALLRFLKCLDGFFIGPAAEDDCWAQRSRSREVQYCGGQSESYSSLAGEGERRMGGKTNLATDGRRQAVEIGAIHHRITAVAAILEGSLDAEVGKTRRLLGVAGAGAGLGAGIGARCGICRLSSSCCCCCCCCNCCCWCAGGGGGGGGSTAVACIAAGIAAGIVAGAACRSSQWFQRF